MRVMATDPWRLKPQELPFDDLEDAGPPKARPEPTESPFPPGLAAYIASAGYTHSCMWTLWPPILWDWINPGTVPPKDLPSKLLRLAQEAAQLHPAAAGRKHVHAAQVYFMRQAERMFKGVGA